MKSRRRFLKLVALGSAVALVPALPRRSRAAAPARAATKPRTAAVEAEIRRQTKATAAALATIRAFPLPAGSEMAFAFAPLRAPRRRGGGPRAGGRGGAP